MGVIDMSGDSDLAEFWWKRQGKRVPRRGTTSWLAMFEAWRAHTLSRDY